MELKYGLNPHASPAFAEPVEPGRWPLVVMHGTPSMINLLDALTAWRLVRTARRELGRPAAASFKHLSPAGAAVDGPVDEAMIAAYRSGRRPLDPAALDSPVARAYLRSRDADPRASYGDVIAVSEPVDEGLTELLGKVASDGIIAPGYAPGCAERLAAKKRGTYLVLEVDPDFEPPEQETREIFGVRLRQPTAGSGTDLAALDAVAAAAAAAAISRRAAEDLLLGAIICANTQSNTVAYVRDRMAVGIGAGQQSRIDCTRIAGEKTDAWFARRHDLAPGGVGVVSDGMIPFVDNVEEVARHGVEWIAEPGGSIRTAEVATACAQRGITHVVTGTRLFLH